MAEKLDEILGDKNIGEDANGPYLWREDGILDKASALIKDYTARIRSKAVEECAKVADDGYKLWSNANGFEGHATASGMLAKRLLQLGKRDA